MNSFGFEWFKLIKRRTSVLLLIVTAILIPAIVIVIMNKTVSSNEISEGLFVNQTAIFILDFIHMYIFLQGWILVFIGIELSNGHASRVVFLKSRNYYFISKLSYCLIVVLFFSLVGLLALVLAIKTSPFSLEVVSTFYLSFFAQSVMSASADAAWMLLIVFIVRSPGISFAVNAVLSFVSALIYLVLEKQHITGARYLPYQFFRIFYSDSGGRGPEEYYNPIVDSPADFVLPLIFTFLLLGIAYAIFKQADLKVLSD